MHFFFPKCDRFSVLGDAIASIYAKVREHYESAAKRGQAKPSLEQEKYKWSQALNYLPFEEGVVIGDEFWNIVGGQTAYEELLDIYLEVGREKGKYMLDTLAFGF